MLHRIVRIQPLRNRPEQTSTCYSASPRKKSLYDIARSKHPHATPHRPDKTFTTSPGSNLRMLPRIVLIQPLRNRHSKPPHATPNRPNKTFTTSSGASFHMLPRIVRIKTLRNHRSKHPHATPHRPENTCTKSSGANLHEPHRIVQIKPLRHRPEQTSTYYPGSSR